MRMNTRSSASPGGDVDSRGGTLKGFDAILPVGNTRSQTFQAGLRWKF